jgi:plasmid replication initiation protein
MLLLHKKGLIMAKLIQVNGDLEVKKADVVVKARYKLNPLPLKFITTLIAGLKRSDDINEEYVFKVRDFKELTGLKRKDLYWAVKEAIKELLEKPLHIQTEDGFIMCNWISGGHYVENAGEVRFMIYPKLRPFLLEAQKKFLKYKIENILPLRSSYSIRMYEILKDWLELNARYGNKAEKIVNLKELREMLKIPKSYIYGMIKKRILEKAKQELSENTDILFEYEEIKTGRKVTHLKFIIRPNPAKLQDNNSTDERYFSSRRNFVSLLRKNYSGNGKFFGFKTFDDGTYWLGLDNNGLVYGTIGGKIKDFNAVESERIYNLWLKIAQNSDLYKELVLNGVCLKDLSQNNKEVWLELREELIRLKEEGII